MTMTNTVAFHPTLTPGDSELGTRIHLAGKDDARPTTPSIPWWFLADGFAQAGETYQKHGDLDMAEFSYKLAYKCASGNSGPTPSRPSRRAATWATFTRPPST